MSAATQKIRGHGKPLIRILVVRALYCIVFAHFAIVAFNQFPDNPLQHQYKVELSRYVDPYFSQAWTLFSPNPINSNMNLLVQFRYRKGGGERVSAWIDLSEPLDKERDEHFWSPAQRITKYLSACMQNITANHTEFLEFIKMVDSTKVAKDSMKFALLYDKSMSATYGHKSIIQYSHYAATKYFGSQITAAKTLSVRYRIFDAKFPRFSKRDQDYYDMKNYTFTQLTSSFYPLH